MALENYEKYIKDFINEDIYSFEDNVKYQKMIKSFQNNFTPEKIVRMTKEDYVYGINGEPNFFLLMTRDTKMVGSVGNRPEFAGIYLQGNKIIRNSKTHKYGVTVDEVFSTYKERMIEIHDAAIIGDNKVLERIDFPNTWKYKMAAMYNPENYFTVFSPRHLRHFLKKMNQDDLYRKKLGYFELVEELLNEKKNCSLVDSFSNHKYSRLLYYLFGKTREDGTIQNIGVIENDNGSKKISDFDDTFPIEQDINDNLVKVRKKEVRYNPDKKLTKIDFEKKQKEQSVRGALAEKKVLEYEKLKLEKNGLKHKVNDIKHISKENDAAGYDILSFNLDGTERYIEVKSTKSNENTFHMSINELLFAKNPKNNEDYWIYYVRKTPDKFLVKEISNPFLPEKIDLLNIQATNFKVHMDFEK